MNIQDSKVAIIGLGYVGLPLAVEFGKTREVVGFDINPNRIAELTAGRDITLEVSSEELSAARFITYTSDRDALKECGIFIVTVPTPIDGANRPDLSPLVNYSQEVCVVPIDNVPPCAPTLKVINACSSGSGCDTSALDRKSVV